MARQPKIDEKRQRAGAKKFASKLGTKENPVGSLFWDEPSPKYAKDPDARSSNPSKSSRPKARPDYSKRPMPRPETARGGPDTEIDLSPRAERNERKEVMGKKCGGSMKKMSGGGMCRGMGKATRGGGYGKMG